VIRIAGRADMSVQTLYSNWGNKRNLLRAVMESSVTGDEDLPLVPGQPPAVFADLPDGAAVDPDIAADWRHLNDLRRQAIHAMLCRLPAAALRPGLTRTAAADTGWVIASPDTHDQLVHQAGYSYDQLEDWVRGTLGAALLA
jgi:AcrR family transcriptional regulator